MSNEDNVRIAREFPKAWNDRDFDRAAKLMADDGEILIVGTGERFIGPAGVVKFSQMWADGFPDGQVEVTDTIAEGDRVVVLYTGVAHTRARSAMRPARSPQRGKRSRSSSATWSRSRTARSCPSARTSTQAPCSRSSVSWPQLPSAQQPDSKPTPTAHPPSRH